jgi:hypothetical protein
VDPETKNGANQWKFEVAVRGQVGDYFEFKSFMRKAGIDTWESDIVQDGTPFKTRNHWARVGYVTRVVFGTAAGTVIEAIADPSLRSLPYAV